MSNVFVPYTGSVSLLPADFDVSTVADAAYPIPEATEVGLIGEDGVTVSNLRASSDPLRVFQNNAAVARVITDVDGISIEIPLAELNETTDRVVFGATADAETGRIDIKPGEVIPAPVCITMISKDRSGGVSDLVLERWILTNASVSEAGDVSYTFGEISVRTVTIVGDVDPETGIAGSYWRTPVVGTTPPAEDPPAGD